MKYLKQKKIYQNFKIIIVIGVILCLIFTTLTSANILQITHSLYKKPLSRGIVWNVTLNLNEPGGSNDTVIFCEAPESYDGQPPLPNTDPYDSSKSSSPPSPTIRAWFNDSLPAPFTELLRDSRHYPNSDKIWNLSILWNSSNSTTITISWSPTEVDNSEYTSVNLCNTTGTPLKNMLVNSSFSILCPPNSSQQLKIICHVNQPPTISDIPDQTIAEGSTFTMINLDDFVSDVDNSDAEMTWTHSGNTELTVSIVARVAIITIPSVDWNGAETITFTVTDPDLASDSDAATFTITAVNDAPVVGDIPDQTIAEGSTFTMINLDDFVSDVDNSVAEMLWMYSGNVQLLVSIVNRVVTITIPNPNWYGSETVLFRATDPGGLWDDDVATFTVTSVNSPPVVGDIPNQTINEGSMFTFIYLDNYVSDVDNSDAEMTWSFSGNSQLSVSINGSRIATITIPNPDWFGSEIITFRATDPGGLWDEDAATFTVTAVNDAPVVGDIPDQTIAEGSAFAVISLDDFVSDVDNSDAEMTWSFSGNVQLLVSIVNRTVTIIIPNPYWYGSEIITFRATDPGGLWAEDAATFMVTNLNDPPLLGTPSPINGSTGNQLSLIWSIPINDTDGDIFSWSIQCSNGQVNSGSGASNGTKALSVSGLAPLTIYKVWVNATDLTGSGVYTRRWFIFTTKINLPPVFGSPTPMNSSTINHQTLTWSIPINDPDGNLFSWSIQCNNGQVSNGSGASNGTKSLSLSGLAPSTNYKVWVNATDPIGSGLFTRKWYMFTTGVNLPPIFGSPIPANSSTNNHLTLNWRIIIIDPDGDLFSWSIQCSNGQANSGSGASNGTKALSIFGLAPLTTYKVWVNATDSTGSGLFTRRWYTFTTGLNLQPVFGTPIPANGSVGNPFSFTWSIPINDPDGDLFSWSIQCSNGQANSGSGASNGTKALSVSGLAPLMNYTIWVNATDITTGGIYTREWFIFMTGLNLQPVFGTPIPANGSMNNPFSFTWNIPINDPDGDHFSWSIQCSNGQANSGSGASNGTKALFVSGLAPLMNYTVWVNATDPMGSGQFTRQWYSFNTKEDTNVPPDKPERPSGSTTGRINVQYTFSSNVSDVDGDQIWFWFDWGDDSESGWVGPFNSGSTGSADHAWTRQGSYEIKVKAKDTSNAESVWSDPLPISMPVGVNSVEGKVKDITPVIRGCQESTVPTNTSYLTGTSPSVYDNSNTRYADYESSPLPENRNFRELIHLIIRIVHGEYIGMNLIKILRTEGWIR
jgi:hypothetical protein